MQPLSLHEKKLFPTDYTEILQKLAQIEPGRYAATRNFLNGAVTRLSPYISRGVISLRQTAFTALQRHRAHEIEKFIQELAWREYWQRIWQVRGPEIFTDLRTEQQGVRHRNMVTALTNAATGIRVIDEQIQELYKTGYLHNHLRMYISSIACNIAGAHWLQPSRWMYYHLLDGDLASNSLSWQWVAGTFSAKKYYCNQSNINYFTGTAEEGSFLDHPCETLTRLPLPAVLSGSLPFEAGTELPATTPPVIPAGIPVLLYNSYQLDPSWHAGTTATRILLLEPSHFNQHPVSPRVLNFILRLAANIPGIQVFSGEWTALKELIPPGTTVIFKEHPAYRHYEGTEEQRSWLFPDVNGWHPSFSAYWKRCRPYLRSLEAAAGRE